MTVAVYKNLAKCWKLPCILRYFRNEVKMRQVGTISRKGQLVNDSYITGFVDGEGSFHIAFQRRPDLKFGWQTIPEFHISQNFTSRNVLEAIKNYFDCGHVKNNDAAGKRDKTMVYVVRDRQDLLNKIIPFFERNLLHTEKRNDFQAFREVVLMLKNNQHSNLEGFRSIVELGYSMNAKGRYRKRNKEEILESLTSSETIR